MSLRNSLTKALSIAAANGPVTLSTSTKRASRGGRQVVILHVGSGSYEFCETERSLVSAIEADLLAAATSYVHGQGGQVL